MRIINSLKTAVLSIRKYGLHSMYLRNLMIVILLSLVPLLLVVFFGANTINDFSRTEINQLYENSTLQMRDTIDYELLRLENTALHIATNQSIDYLRKIDAIESLHDYDAYINLKYLYKIIDNNIQMNSHINTIKCYFSNSGTLLTGRPNYGCTLSADRDIDFENMMYEAVDSMMTNKIFRYWTNSNNAAYITVIYRAPIQSPYNHNLVLVTAEADGFYKLINKNSNDYSREAILIEGETGTIISKDEYMENTHVSGDAMINFVGESGFFEVEENDENTVWFYAKSEVADIVIVSKIFSDDYFSHRGKRQTIFIFAVIASAAIAAFLSIIGTSRFSEPIEMLISIINRPEEWLEGDATKKPKAVEMKYLTRNLLTTYQRNTELEDELLNRVKSLHRAQLSALQSQINPHFLFNTLESINWSVREEAGLNNATSDLIDSLSTFLRYALESDENLVPIEQEIKHARAYVDIQLHRYNGRFVVEWQVDEKLMDVPIVKITLQPLIENAISHGIKNMDKGGRIYVGISREKDTVMIQVCDNGNGIDKKKITLINERFKKNTDFVHLPVDHIGLNNVYLRYRLLFGESVEMMIHKNHEWNTRVSLSYQYSENNVK